MNENVDGCEYMGRFIREGDGLYDGCSQNFFRGGFRGISRTLKCDDNAAVCVRDNKFVMKRYRIRKLTPTECFRLMGVDDASIQKMRGRISDSQCYKLAGNSIVVDVLVEGIFRPLLLEEPEMDTLF